MDSLPVDSYGRAMPESMNQWTTQELLQFLMEHGYGAKSLSVALLHKINYKSLHRWKSGAFKPRKPRDHVLILAFAQEVAARTKPPVEEAPF